MPSPEWPATRAASLPDDARNLLHELRVHHIQLEQQNEELRQAQIALEESRARYVELFDLAPVGYLILDPAGDIQDANLAAARLLGEVRQHLPGRALSSFIHPDDSPLYQQYRARLGTGDAPSGQDLRLRQPLGLPRWIHLLLAPWESASSRGAATGMARQLATLSDIGERKTLESKLREEAVRRERFIAMLGHEIRNPLSPIRQIADTLEHNPEVEPALLRQLLGIIVRQTRHIGRLMDDLLDLARVRQGRILLRFQPCELEKIVSDCVDQLRPLLAKRHQSIGVHIPTKPLILEGDPIRLAQVIANLLRNASDASAAHTTIGLFVARHSAGTEIQLRDQGRGMAPEIIATVNAVSNRPKAELLATSGPLGMGLDLSKHLVELHGGRLSAESAAPNPGTLVRVRLQLSAADSATETTIDTTTDQPTAPPAASSPLRVLLVEDDEDVATACLMVLELSGETAVWAADGPAALALVERLRPDVILLDLGLPGMDGFAVARRLRETPSGRDARIVALSGHGQAADIARAKEAGCDDHVLKPLGVDELRNLLRPPPRIVYNEARAGVQDLTLCI